MLTEDLHVQYNPEVEQVKIFFPPKKYTVPGFLLATIKTSRVSLCLRM